MIDIVVGEITEVSPDGTIKIIAKIDMEAYVKKGYKLVTIYLQDSRTLSDKQRRFCYSLIADIADWMGEHSKSADRELVKQYLKLKHITEDMEPLAAHLFSMSNAPMDVINDFLRFLIDFILQNDIPTKVSLLDYVDENNYENFIYSCLMNKRCCVCGKPAQLHHIDRVGAGHNRNKIIHIGMEVMPICDSHHKEIDFIGRIFFYEKYHLTGGVKLDKTLCRLFGLKAGKEVEE